MQKKRGVCKAGDAHNRIPGCTGLRLSLTCITGTLACLLHRVPYFYTRSRNLLHYIGKNTSMSCQGTLIDQESSLAQHTACRKPRNKSTYKTSLLHGSRQKSDLTLKRLMSYIYIYIYGAPIRDVSKSHTTTQHSR